MSEIKKLTSKDVITLCEKSTSSSYNYEGLVKTDTFKFKIKYELSNGTPCGSDWKRCIRVLTNEGKWDFVDDIHTILPNPSYDQSYYASELDKVNGRKEFVKACLKYITLIYL